jgi:hypothetical protein
MTPCLACNVLVHFGWGRAAITVSLSDGVVHKSHYQSIAFALLLMSARLQR